MTSPLTEPNATSDDPALSHVLDILAGISSEIAVIESEQATIPGRLKKLGRKMELWTEVRKILSDSSYDPDGQTKAAP